MNHIYKVCPVCDQPLEGTEEYCPECRFELRIYPTFMPPQVEKLERERIAVARSHYQELRAKYQDVRAIADREKEQQGQEIAKLRQEAENRKTELQSTAEQLAAQQQLLAAETAKLQQEQQNIQELNSQLAASQAELQKKQDELNQAKASSKQSSEEIAKQKSELERKDKKISDQEKSIKQLKIEIANLKSKPTTTVVEKKKVGYLIMQLVDEELVGALPVFVGENVYGKNPVQRDGVYTHRISMLDPTLQPEHFKIVADEDGESIKATLIAGRWSVNNLANHPEICNVEVLDQFIFSEFRLIFVDSNE